MDVCESMEHLFGENEMKYILAVLPTISKPCLRYKLDNGSIAVSFTVHG